MSIIHVNHIKADCKARFEKLIDLSDVHTMHSGEIENHFYTRALAAFALATLAKVDDAVAVEAITDEQGDDGLDAFLFDRSEHACYLVQSKWSSAGTGSIDVGSVLKFIQGVRHFLQAQTEFFGPKLAKRINEVNDALSDSAAHFFFVIAYTGGSTLSKDAQEPLDEYITELNDDSDSASLEILHQQKLHKVVAQKAIGGAVDLTIMLRDYGKIREPYASYYGSVNVTDILAWNKYGDRIYHRNIRNFKTSTDVNEAIVKTLKEEPDKFVYFNNGITITCSEINRKPLGGTDRASGVFECKGASVVNGAQTVGSIISALNGLDHTTCNARVMVRLTSLEKCPEGFSSEITRAVNTQNRIERRDFAALDPTQTRLKTEFQLSFQKEYVYRTGDAEPLPEHGCTLDEASVALACANPDINLALQAKREVGKLYEDIERPPYTILFNQSTNVQHMWRAIQVMRSVDVTLKEVQSNEEGKSRLIAVHFNRLILHLVFRRIGNLLVDNNEWDLLLKGIPTIARDVLGSMTQVITDRYPTAYAGSLFKNATKSKDIASKVNPSKLNSSFQNPLFNDASEVVR